MATYEFYLYTPEALAYNSGTGDFDFAADYSPFQDRFRVVVEDNDSVLNSSGDFNQIATVYDLDGNIVASGPITVPIYGIMDDPNSSTDIFIDRIEVNGVLVGHITSEPLLPGESYPYLSNGYYEDYYSYYTENSVPCFGPGSHLLTTEGEVPVEWLTAGQMLITKDAAPQPILWVGRYTVTLARLLARPALAPLEIVENAFGPGCPNHPLSLSHQHRVLLSGYQLELHAGVDEAFAAIGFLEGSDLVRLKPATGDIEYTHVLLPRHCVVKANGIWTESLFLGDGIEAELARSLPAALSNDPALAAGHSQTARLCLKRWQVRAMLGLPDARMMHSVLHRVA